MKKRYIIIIVSIILTIAYMDFVDSLRRFEHMLSQMIKLEADIETTVDTKIFKTQK